MRLNQSGLKSSSYLCSDRCFGSPASEHISAIAVALAAQLNYVQPMEALVRALNFKDFTISACRKGAGAAISGRASGLIVKCGY